MIDRILYKHKWLVGSNFDTCFKIQDNLDKCCTTTFIDNIQWNISLANMMHEFSSNLYGVFILKVRCKLLTLYW